MTASQLRTAVGKQPPITQWAVLLFRAGYFAGAIFQGKDAKPCHAIVHKCFQRYTVRKKQGGAQSTHDAEGGKARSAGSWLRRQNTIALREDIHLLLASWGALLTSCTRIFIAASKRSVSTLYCDALHRGASTLVIKIMDTQCPVWLLVWFVVCVCVLGAQMTPESVRCRSQPIVLHMRKQCLYDSLVPLWTINVSLMHSLVCDDRRCLRNFQV